MSFGKAFGALIKTKRGIEGLTQEALAVLAFGKESSKTRISELENGEVKNPHAKTIDALTIALNISHEELVSLKQTWRQQMIQEALADDTDDIGYSIPPLEFHMNLYGHLVISHTDPWPVQIEQFEYYASNDTLVVLCTDGTSVPFLSSMPDHIVQRLPEQKAVISLLYERGPQPDVLKKEEYKLVYFI